MKGLKLAIAIACFGLFTHAAVAQNEEKVNRAIELFNQSVASYEGGSYDNALKQADDALLLVADKPEGSEKVSEQLEKIIPRIHYGKANKQLKEKEYTAALKTLGEAVAVATKYGSDEVLKDAKELIPQVYTAQAGSEFSAKNFEQAITNAEHAIEAGATGSKVYLIKALSHMQLNDGAKAEEMLLKTVEVAKASGDEADEATANGQLSTMFLKEAVSAQKAKRWADVLLNAEKSLKYKESTNGYKLKGAAATSLKKWDVAISAYTALLNDPKEVAGANYNLGVAYLGKANTGKACEHFKKVGNDPTYKTPAEQQMKIAKCS